jgi:hypothetical protein
MRNVFMVVLGLLICSFVSCATSSYGKLTNSMNLTAGQNESEIIIRRPKSVLSSLDSSIKQVIFIDGQPCLTLKNNSVVKIIVKNGTHTMYAEHASIKSENVEFIAESNRITFSTSLSVFRENFSSPGKLLLSIEKESEFALSPASE